VILRRLRGIATMAVLWGGVWAVASLPFAAWISRIALKIPGLTPSRWEVALSVVQQFAATGAIGGAVFAIVFMAIERNRRVEDVSLGRGALWGFVGGIAFPILVLSAALVGGAGLPWGLSVLAISGALGAGCAAASLALARRAPEPAQIPARE
jgi:hypothetical protein